MNWKKYEDVEFTLVHIFQHNFLSDSIIFWYYFNYVFNRNWAFILYLRILLPIDFTAYIIAGLKHSEETLAVCCYLHGNPIKLVKKLDVWCRCETSMSVWVRSIDPVDGCVNFVKTVIVARSATLKLGALFGLVWHRFFLSNDSCPICHYYLIGTHRCR